LAFPERVTLRSLPAVKRSTVIYRHRFLTLGFSVWAGFAKPKTRADCHAEQQPKQKDFGDRPKGDPQPVRLGLERGGAGHEGLAERPEGNRRSLKQHHKRSGLSNW
jgi:hypothetical protein